MSLLSCYCFLVRWSLRLILSQYLHSLRRWGLHEDWHWFSSEKASSMMVQRLLSFSSFWRSLSQGENDMRAYLRIWSSDSIRFSEVHSSMSRGLFPSFWWSSSVSSSAGSWDLVFLDWFHSFVRRKCSKWVWHWSSHMRHFWSQSG